MTVIDMLSKMLLAPPEKGKRGLLYAIVLVGLPTLMRFAVSGFMAGLPFIAYFPFVFVAAILLNWRYAAATSLASAIIADWMFVGPPQQLFEGPSDVFGVVIFLTTSAMMIGLVEAARSIVENSLRPARPDAFTTPVVFSLEGGQAWASWYGSHSWVRLGPDDEVAEMMEDFLAQRELGKRLTKQAH
jgi:hypothetical protein